MGRKVNKNLYEITGLVGKPGLISLRRPFRSRYPLVPPVGLTVRRVLYSTHHEDSHYREQSRRIVRGRAGPRQIVTYFTFFPKGPADLLVPLPPAASGQMMHAEEMVAGEATGRSLAFSWTREPSNRRRKIAIALPTPLRDRAQSLPSTILAAVALAGHLCHERITGSDRRNYGDNYKILGIKKKKKKIKELR